MKTTPWIVGLAALCASACAKPPVQEISDAQTAINAAVQAGAEDYAADQLRLARDAFTAANNQVDAKDYKTAKASAIDAKAKAEAAEAVVEAGRAQAKMEAEAKLATLKAETDALEKSVRHAKGREIPSILRDLGDLNVHFDIMRADIDGGRAKAALERADMETALLSDLRERVDKATKKSKKR